MADVTWIYYASGGLLFSVAVATFILIMIGIRYGTKTFGRGLISSLINVIFINSIVVSVFMFLDILAAYYGYQYLYAIRGIVLLSVPGVNLYGMLLVKKYAKSLMAGVEGLGGRNERDVL